MGQRVALLLPGPCLGPCPTASHPSLAEEGGHQKGQRAIPSGVSHCHKVSACSSSAPEPGESSSGTTRLQPHSMSKIGTQADGLW